MNRAPAPDRRQCRRFRTIDGGLLLGYCLLLAGCGVQAYEAQLNNANDLFNYQNRLDQSLVRTPWEAPGYGVSMRVPLGYGAIPAPAAAVPKDGEDVEAESPVDLRQPTYLGVPEIEGLIGAWKASVPSRDGGSAVVFLYVFGNHGRLLKGSAADALPKDKYFEDLETVLQTQLGVTIEQGSQPANLANVKFEESLPREEKFVRKKHFDAVRLVPTDSALRELQLPKLEAYLYETTAGSIQVAILMVAPESVRDNPDTALRVALETLSVSDQAPQLKADGQVGQPAGKSGF